MTKVNTIAALYDNFKSYIIENNSFKAWWWKYYTQFYFSSTSNNKIAFNIRLNINSNIICLFEISEDSAPIYVSYTETVLTVIIVKRVH